MFKLQPIHELKYLDIQNSARESQTTKKFKHNRVVTDRTRFETLFPETGEIAILKDKIFNLENLVHSQQREIEQLKQMNSYLIKANQQKVDLIFQERQSSLKLQGTMHKQQTGIVRDSLLNQSQGSIKKEAVSPRKVNIRHATMKISQDMDFDRNENKEKDKLSQNFQAFLQMEECFKINMILNIQMEDNEAYSLYENDGTISLLQHLLMEEETFTEVFANSGPQRMSFLYDKFRKILIDHQQLFCLVLRMKKIILGAIEMSKQVIFDEALLKIVDEIIGCLECDRASCFVVDHAKNELWSKVFKGASQIIRFPLGKGLAGYVAQKRELVNVENAYLDPRFNQDIDVRTNYKTKTMLVCPISEGDKCIGVLQCVNKLRGNFTKEDEGLLIILAQFSRLVLNNAFNRDEQLLVHNKLRHTIKSGLQLGRHFSDLKQFIVIAQNRLKALMNVDFSKVALVNRKEQKIVCLDDEEQLQKIDMDVGIMGVMIKQNQYINLFSCYAHPQFNPMIDIDTNMPVIIMPLVHPEDSKIVIGGIEVINMKGIGTMFQQVQPKITSVDLEVLQFFSQQCAQYYFPEWDKE